MCYALCAGQTSSSLVLLVKSQIGRKQFGQTLFATQQERDRAPVKRTRITGEMTLR